MRRLLRRLFGGRAPEAEAEPEPEKLPEVMGRLVETDARGLFVPFGHFKIRACSDTKAKAGVKVVLKPRGEMMTTGWYVLIDGESEMWHPGHDIEEPKNERKMPALRQARRDSTR